MDWTLNKNMMEHWVSEIEQWFVMHVFSWEFLMQVIALLIIFLIGFVMGRPLRSLIGKKTNKMLLNYPLLNNFIIHSVRLIPFYIGVIILWISEQVFLKLSINQFLLNLFLSLSVAWVIIQLASSVILDRYWARIVAIIVWFLAALNLIGIFDRAILLLENSGFSIGQTRLTILSLIQAAIILVVLLKIVHWSSNYLERQLEHVPGLNDSSRLMMAKVVNVFLIVMVTLIVLNSVGIDFSSLAIFSGAIGVGVGFGLQKVVGNYISGLILLSDKSIKPGDVIQISDTFGKVRIMGGRYVSVVTRDEKEYLIPNEDLITNQVINWSYSSSEIRVVVPFGVSYKAEPQKVIQLVAEAVKGIDRILAEPKPVCLLMDFGDSSVDFELRFWIRDPQNGLSNIKSEVLLKVWDTLKDNQIEIPYPQRDVHIRS